MASEKAVALVIRTWDWSETSRIAVLWTREFGKVRVVAKGGRRLKSPFECSLDLLSVCNIVFLRKSTGGLDILTEAQVHEQFPQLRGNLEALYAGYYVAELLSELTQDFDPHPALFDAALATLRDLGKEGVLTGPRLIAFELAFLRELGYGPALETCALCNRELTAAGLTLPELTLPELTLPELTLPALTFASEAGGVLCPGCQASRRGRRDLSAESWRTLRDLQANADAWSRVQEARLRSEIRQVLDDYVTYLMGRRPRLLPYLGS